MIEIYPGILPGRPVETHEFEGTIGDWLSAQGLPWRGRDVQPVEIAVNGRVIHSALWDETEVVEADRVSIRVLPAGGIVNAVGSLLRKVLSWIGLAPAGGGPSYETADGSDINAADGKANIAKLGEVVPELFGRFRRFPDYISAPRRYFASPREQVLTFAVCVGPGDYYIDPAEVRVGSTLVEEAGGQWQEYAPGADVSADEAFEHWYSAPEVGVTSGGTAGLELGSDAGDVLIPDADGIDFDGPDLSIRPGEGEFPPAWGAGTNLRLWQLKTYTVSNEETAPGSGIWVYKLFGNFSEVLPTIGAEIRLYTPASPTVGFVYFIEHMEIDSSGDGWISMRDGDFTPVALPVGPGTYGVARPYWTYRVAAVSPSSLQLQAVDPVGSPISGWAGWPAEYVVDVRWWVDESTVYGEAAGPYVGCPEGQGSSTYELDFFFQGGLARGSGGNLSPRTVSVEIAYRPADTADLWTVETRTYTDSTLDQIGFTERLILPEGRYEFRCRRVGARDADANVRDDLQWYGLRCQLPTRSDYPNWTTMSLRLTGGTGIGARSENRISVVPTRILPALLPDGSWSAPQPTRDISAAVRHIASTIGYTDADLDMEELQRLHQIWTARGDFADGVIDLTTVRDAINRVLAAGMAELTVEDGLIRPVRDEPRTVFEHAYSAQNMASALRQDFAGITLDDVDGVEVEYTDATTWTKEVVLCLLPGDAGLKTEKIRLETVTDRTRAWRIGMRRRRVLRYRRWTYSWGTELDALNSRYLSYVPIIQDVPGYGQSAILMDIQAHSGGALLALSEPLTWEPGQDHVVAYRDVDGRLVGPWAATPGPSEYQVVAPIPEPWPEVTLRHEPPHVYFGTTEKWTWPALVTRISPQPGGTASVEAVNYDQRVYLDDDNAPSA